MPENVSELPVSHQSVSETSLEVGGDTGLEPWRREVDGMYRAIGFIHRKARREDVGFGSDDIAGNAVLLCDMQGYCTQAYIG